MKRNQIVDEDTGRVDLRYNAMSVDEDFYIPIRGAASNTRIETLAGGQFTGDIDDVNYLRDKLFSALKVPKAYLAQSDAQEDKTTLSQKDIRFARTIQRLQRVIVAELEKICIIHLYTLGYRNNDLLSFKLALNNPSKIAELQELEHMRTKFDVAGSATDGYFSKQWVYRNIFKISEEEIDRIQVEQFTDALHGAAIEGAGTPPEGGEGGDLGDLGGDDLGGDLGDLGGEEGGEEPAEEGPLLAEPEIEPGQRDDNGYMRVKSPKWKQGARRRSMNGSYNREKAGSSRRALFNGYGEMSALANGIHSEGQQTEEDLIFETQFDIKQLIKQLETKDEGQA